MYIKYNQNPCNKRTIDCTVRALATLLDKDWNSVYIDLCMVGYNLCDMPSSKVVVNHYLKANGYRRYIADDGCTVEDFADEHRKGRYLLATDTHVVPVVDGGNYIDTWNSGKEIVLYYWKEEDR